MKNFTAVFLLLTVAAVCAAEKPNFIFILTDDQGWSEISTPVDLSLIHI